MTKGLKQVRGTPITQRKVTEADGHWKPEFPPKRQPVPDSSVKESAEQAVRRRFREGGKD
jgi:hypothetical protein